MTVNSLCYTYKILLVLLKLNIKKVGLPRYNTEYISHTQGPCHGTTTIYLYLPLFSDTYPYLYCRYLFVVGREVRRIHPWLSGDHPTLEFNLVYFSFVDIVI